MIRTAAKPSKLDQQRALLGAVPKPVTQAVEEAMSGLPALVKAAADKLAGATTAAQVLDAKDAAGLAYDASKRAARVMKAKGAHDQVVAAAHRAQADALEIEAAAKRRLADEYDSAQEKGEAARPGRPKKTDWEKRLEDKTFFKPGDGKLAAEKFADDLGLGPAQVHELDLSKSVIHDARAIRDVIASNPTAVREALDDILAKGDEPTRAALKRAIAPATTAIRADQTAAKKARRSERETILAEKIKALPDEKFGVIVADPEWRFEPYSRETGMDRAADNHYPTSDLEIIKARSVPSIAAPDCVLFLWATAPMLPQALEVMSAWGFAYVTQAVWVKQRTGEGRGSGYWFTGEHEILLVGTRGKVVAPAPGTQFPSVIFAPVGEHSAKPVEALEIVEAYFPNLPKIELNRRGPARVGWSAWGQEAEYQAKPSEDNGRTSIAEDAPVTGEGSRQRQRRRDGGERPAPNHEMDRATEGSFETGSEAAEKGREAIPAGPEGADLSHAGADESSATGDATPPAAPVTIPEDDVPAFLKKPSKPLRPHCLKPDLCAGSGKKHCHQCSKAAEIDEAAA